MKQNILVIGGTGKTGRRVVEGLNKNGQKVTIASRKGFPAFDWNDPASYAKVLAGMNRAYITYYPDLAVPGAKEAIQALTSAAVEAGLEKVVLLSGKGEKEAEACESIVASSGLNFTVVRASWFNQNFSESFLLEPIQAGMVALPMTQALIPFVDADDIAEVVVKVLLDDSYNGRTITVTGPRKLTFEQAISEIAEGSGRKIRFQPISLEQNKTAMQQAGLPDDYVWLFNYLFKEVLGNPENQEISKDIEQVLGRKAIDFSDYVKRTASSGIWNQSLVQSL
jgi:uncharacterized protein YbjT (DUF2867 family)